jgi:excisionase family DNA binding protein
MPLADPGYLTVAETARLLRISKMAVYRLIARGEIDAMRIGERSLRIPEDAVRKYLPGPAA